MILPFRLDLCLVFLLSSCLAVAQQPDPSQFVTETGIAYRTSDDAYVNQMCVLDVHHPTTGQSDLPTIVWFHGGGLKGGKRTLPKPLQQQGVVVVTADYRLSPKVKVVDCIDDAAAAVAWTFANIDKYGGSPDKIIISGHSAGGYLTSMLGLDKSWLDRHGIDADRVAGLVPFSGHTITHFTVRKEMGMKDTQPLVDKMAPLFHVRSDAPPMLLITGDRELEMLGRYEENAYLWRMMQVAGHDQTTLYELDGFNHGQMAQPAFPLLVRFAKQVTKPKPETSSPAGN